MCGGVSTVHAAASQIDDDVASIDFALPIAEGRATPATAARRDGSRRRLAAVGMKCPSEHRANLSDPPGMTSFIDPLRRTSHSNISEHVQ